MQTIDCEPLKKKAHLQGVWEEATDYGHQKYGIRGPQVPVLLCFAYSELGGATQGFSIGGTGLFTQSAGSSCYEAVFHVQRTMRLVDASIGEGHKRQQLFVAPDWALSKERSL